MISRFLIRIFVFPFILSLDPGRLHATEVPATDGVETVVFDRTGEIELARFTGSHPDETGWQAPHFIRRVRSELARNLCGTPKAAACRKLATRRYRVISSLDWEMQTTAEKYLKATAIAPHQEDMEGYLETLGVPYRKWLWRLRDYEVHNAALAAVDYQNGQILAYAGSADAKSDESNAAFHPDFDILQDGWRQSGSTFKPYVYLPGILSGELTAATVFMDVATEFEKGYWPRDTDRLERGPVRLRDAVAFSINVPAVKAASTQGTEKIKALAKKFGLRFRSNMPDPGSAIALGVMEVHPMDMLGAYGTIANAGVLVPETTLVTVTDKNGEAIEIKTHSKSRSKTVISPQAAFIMTSILASTTADRDHNPYWGKFSLEKDGKNRPAALKTGTSDGARDTAAYGYLAPPGKANTGIPALIVGVWVGNNDSSPMGRLTSLNTATPLWQNFVSEVSARWPVADFSPPSTGMVKANIDVYSGKLPGPYAEKIMEEWFVEGTLPAVDDTKIVAEVDPVSGRLWREGCQGIPSKRVFLDPSKLVGDHPQWSKFNRDWVARARKGSGIPGGFWATQTTYFFDLDFHPFGATWGAPFLPTEMCDVHVAQQDEGHS